MDDTRRAELLRQDIQRRKGRINDEIRGLLGELKQRENPDHAFDSMMKSNLMLTSFVETWRKSSLELCIEIAKKLLELEELEKL